jgi:hypothetical protein
LVISDANILGSLDEMLTARMLYPDAGPRVSRAAEILQGRISGIMLSIRALDRFWCSALPAAVAQGASVPDRASLGVLARASRGWREVIDDVAQAMPGVPLRVSPFEVFAGRPDALLTTGAGINAPVDTQRVCRGRAPALPDLRRVLNDRGEAPGALPFGMGQWNPFTNEEHAILREKHADDMMWLTSGAEGKAILTEDDLRDRTGPTPSARVLGKGQSDELEERRVARPRGG